MKINILGALAVLGSGAFFAAVYTTGTTAKVAPDTVVSQIGLDPGTRCTRLRWPKLTAKQIRDYTARPSGPGTRCGRLYAKPTATHLPNQPPVISSLRPQYVTGPDDTIWPVPNSGKLAMTGIGRDPDGDTMFYTYTSTGGRVTGDGPVQDWDLSAAAPGMYTITVEVDDGCGCIAFKSAKALVGEMTADIASGLRTAADTETASKLSLGALRKEFYDNDRDGAISDLTQAVQLDPSAYHYSQLAGALLRKGDFDSAILNFTEAIRVEPSTARRYEDRGNAYAKKGAIELALADLDRSLQIDPKYASAYVTRAALKTLFGGL